LARANPNGFVGELPEYVSINEVQWDNSCSDGWRAVA
jgi:hypothetical protein